MLLSLGHFAHILEGPERAIADGAAEFFSFRSSDNIECMKLVHVERISSRGFAEWSVIDGRSFIYADRLISVLIEQAEGDAKGRVARELATFMAAAANQ